MNSFGENNADQLGTASKQQVRLDCFSVSCFQVVKTERILEDVNGSFNENAVFVEVIPMLGVSRNTRTITKILVRIGIYAFAVRRIGTRRITDADSRIAFLNRFRANPLAAYGTVFYLRNYLRR